MKNKLKIFTKHKAFTLIELLVVIAFISIMSAVVLTSYQSSRTKKAVETEARKVAAAVREAQNDALTGKGAGGCGGYVFTYTSGTGNYGIGGCLTANYTMINSVTFSNGGVFTFAAPWGNITSTAPLTLPATITVTKGSYCSNVVVNSAGNVTEGPIYSC